MEREEDLPCLLEFRGHVARRSGMDKKILVHAVGDALSELPLRGSKAGVGPCYGRWPLSTTPAPQAEKSEEVISRLSPGLGHVGPCLR